MPMSNEAKFRRHVDRAVEKGKAAPPINVYLGNLRRRNAELEKRETCHNNDHEKLAENVQRIELLETELKLSKARCQELQADVKATKKQRNDDADRLYKEMDQMAVEHNRVVTDLKGSLKIRETEMEYREELEKNPSDPLNTEKKFMQLYYLLRSYQELCTQGEIDEIFEMKDDKMQEQVSYEINAMLAMKSTYGCGVVLDTRPCLYPISSAKVFVATFSPVLNITSLFATSG